MFTSVVLSLTGYDCRCTSETVCSVSSGRGSTPLFMTSCHACFCQCVNARPCVRLDGAWDVYVWGRGGFTAWDGRSGRWSHLALLDQETHACITEACSTTHVRNGNAHHLAKSHLIHTSSCEVLPYVQVQLVKFDDKYKYGFTFHYIHCIVWAFLDHSAFI